MLPPGETLLLTLRLPGRHGPRAKRRAPPSAGRWHRLSPWPKNFFANYDAALDRASSGPQYFESEQLAEVLAGEIMMLEEIGFVVYTFVILPNHVHLVLHLPVRSRLAFAPAIDLLHQHT
ncbi:MAG: hypothetical protein EOO62_14800, partial [Hymenobacter sp.]